MRPLAAILAGGAARRMGGVCKALVEVDGRAILDHQLAALVPRFARIAAVLARDSSAEDAAPFAARRLEVVRDDVADCGPLAGLAAALRWADGAPLFALACDMPGVAPRAIDLVLARAALTSADLVVPQVDARVQPLFAIYGPRCAAVVDRAIADRRLRLASLPDAARAAGLTVEKIDEVELRNVDSDLRSFVNLNRPFDSA